MNNDTEETKETVPESPTPAPTPPPPPAPDSRSADDYVKAAYESFLAHLPENSESTNPIKAIEEYFERHATDELKAKCKAEGKTAEGAWNFAWAVGEKMPASSRSGGGFHIEPSVLYAIIMHYFQDVSALARFEPAIQKALDEERKAKAAAEAKARAAQKKSAPKKKNAQKPKPLAKAAKPASKTSAPSGRGGEASPSPSTPAPAKPKKPAPETPDHIQDSFL